MSHHASTVTSSLAKIVGGVDRVSRALTEAEQLATNADLFLDNDEPQAALLAYHKSYLLLKGAVETLEQLAAAERDELAEPLNDCGRCMGIGQYPVGDTIVDCWCYEQDRQALTQILNDEDEARDLLRATEGV